MDSQYRRLGLFVAAATLLGGTFVAARAGLAYFPPLLFVALRFDLAAVVMLTYVALTREDWRPRTRRDVLGVLVTGIPVLGVSNALLFTGQQFTTSAVASIIFSFAPVLTPVFAFFLLADERISARGVVGLLVGLLGVAIVIDVDPQTLLAGDLTGQLILLCGATSVALGSVLIGRVDADLSSTVETAWGSPSARRPYTSGASRSGSRSPPSSGRERQLSLCCTSPSSPARSPMPRISRCSPRAARSRRT